MDYDSLESLRRNHPAWKLLVADHAPLVIGFLHQAFLISNVRVLGESQLVSRLEDYLFVLRERLGAERFPKSAAQYLEDWARDDHRWLRKFHVPETDEPQLEPTPAAEKAIEWLDSLQQHHFVATESRLLMVFELLRQLTEGTETNPEARIAELEKRKSNIDAQIERLRSGRVDLMDSSQVKDRFLQMVSTARGLLSDFRMVDQNFRNLDRSVRERIAVWEGGKGELLEKVFGDSDAISDSDQGRSFRAFWDFLMSSEKQDELSARLESVLRLPAVQELAPDPRLARVHFDWLEAGEVALRTVARLSEQLRRYLDDQAWLENKRIMALLREVEQHALAVGENPPEGCFMELDETGPSLELPMERLLARVSRRQDLSRQVLLEGSEDISIDMLFSQFFVDKVQLASNIRAALQLKQKIELSELLERHPLRQGLAELIAYLGLAADSPKAVIEDETRQTVQWLDFNGVARRATLPRVIFTR